MKTRLLSIATILCAFGALNVHAETVADALEKCRSTENSLKRLMCYDNVAKSLNKYEGSDAQIGPLQTYKATKGNQVNPQPDLSSKGHVQASEPKNDFGLEYKRDLSKEASEIAVTIVSIEKNLRDNHIITFSDGSVWRQTDGTYMKLEEGQPVAIERGILGAFFLSVEGLNKRMKVKRVK